MNANCETVECHHGLWEYRPGKEISVCGEHFEPCNATTLAYACARLRALDDEGVPVCNGAASELRLRAWLAWQRREEPCVHRLNIDGWCVYCGRAARELSEELLVTQAKADEKVRAAWERQRLRDVQALELRLGSGMRVVDVAPPPCECGPGIAARTDLPAPPTPLVMAFDDPTGDDVCAPADSALWRST